MDIIIKKRHNPWPGVILPANFRMKIEPDEIAEALIRRGFAEKVAEDVIEAERAAAAPKKRSRGSE